jgi:Mo-co oxidoreductase dimerisation domain
VFLLNAHVAEQHFRLSPNSAAIYPHSFSLVGHWQQNDYKFLSPCTQWGSTVDYTCVPAIQDMPVQSAILSPLNGAQLVNGSDHIEVEGYAWSGGGRKVIRLDVSLDAGHTWHAASFQYQEVEAQVCLRLCGVCMCCVSVCVCVYVLCLCAVSERDVRVGKSVCVCM